jgi:hypothetical protein
MSESLVFESRTRPGHWFWLATNGKHGWTHSETEAWRHVDRHDTTRDAA